MGSIVAIGAYLAARDLFSGLMVSGSCLYPSPEIKTPLNLFLAKTFSGVWPTMNAAKIVVDDVSLNVAFRQSQLRDPLMHHGSLNVRWGHEMLLANARFTKSLPELTGPVRCIHGSADKVTLLEGSKLIMRRAVNAKRDMYTFAGKYHDIFSHRDVFEDAVALVLDFVHEVSNGTAGVAAPSEVKARHVDRQCPPAAPATPAK
jgi:alpha-beta hydrolase superfamily lysophospholipase